MTDPAGGSERRQRRAEDAFGHVADLARGGLDGDRREALHPPGALELDADAVRIALHDEDPAFEGAVAVHAGHRLRDLLLEPLREHRVTVLELVDGKPHAGHGP